MIGRDNPRDLGIPYDSWRPGQFEAIQRIQNTDKNVVILEAPTGSGKTAIGLALGSRYRKVRALTFTRSLQNQYADYPETAALYGMNAYPCPLFGMGVNADTCAFPENMLKCNHAAEGLCSYVTEREKTRMSARQALSYQYYFNASWPKKSSGKVDYLYCDEAHSLPQLIMSHMALVFEPHTLAKLGLEPIPTLPPAQIVSIKITLRWLERIMEQIKQQMEDMGDRSDNMGFIRRKKSLKNLISSIWVTYRAMDEHKNSFYIVVDENGVLKISPLTPAPFFFHLFNVPDTKLILASATTGNHGEFAALLGLSRGYTSHIVPPVYPPSSQPVYTYGDAPKMGYKSGPGAVKKQISIIRNIIDEFPNDSHALIHFVSKKTARDYANILSHYYGNRIWMPSDKHTTEQKAKAWAMQKKKNPGTICLAWSFHTGVDAPDVDINITQKVPFLALDEVNSQILKRNPRMYSWLAGIAMEQSSGRIRRGDPGHYEVHGEAKRKHVAIIDNNYHMVKKYFSDHFKKCITKE